jgi:hypothetical protein
MKKLLAITLLFLALLCSGADRYVPDFLNAISVTVRAELDYRKSEGSGSLFVRKIGDRNATLCWSAGHVVEHLRKIEESIVDGKPSKKITFENPKLVRELRNKDGRRTGEVVVDAKVIRYSPANKHDLALLMVLSEDFIPEASVEFLPKDAPLTRVGAHVWHCGSLLGSGNNGEGSGHNSITDGVLSAHGRLLFKQPFCQTTAPAYPGSSGGVISNSSGEYIGMLVRGAGSDFNLCVPVARMWKWAEKNRVEWAMNPKLKITQEEINKLPIEGPLVPSKAEKGDHKLYPFMIRRTGFNEK